MTFSTMIGFVTSFIGRHNDKN